MFPSAVWLARGDAARRSGAREAEAYLGRNARLIEEPGADGGEQPPPEPPRFQAEWETVAGRDLACIVFDYPDAHDEALEWCLNVSLVGHERWVELSVLIVAL